MKRFTRTSLQIAASLAAVCVVGCASEKPAPLTAATPVVTGQPASVTVVAGAGATFTVAASANNGTLTYQWRKDGAALASGGAATSLVLTAVTSSSAGVYDCIVTNTLFGTSAVAVSSGAVLAVNTAPAIVVQPVAQSTAPGGSVIFMVAASGNGTLSYQWKKDGVDILGATQPSYAISAATAASAGNYSCAVTNTLGSTTTSTVTAAAALTVGPGSPTAPVITSQPVSAAVAAGANASFTVAATGNGTLSYQWRKNGVVQAGATSATLALAGVTAVSAGVYDCIVTNTLGSASSIAISAGAVLQVNAAPVILAQPTNQAAPPNGSATFSVVASGSGTLTYQWRKDLTAIPGATSSSYTVSSVSAASVGSYDCVVSNTLVSTTASTTSAAATLTLSAPSSITLTAQSGSQTVAEGATAAFSVSASSTGSLSYQWYKGSSALSDGGSLSGTHAATLTLTGATFADAANYSCLITSNTGGALATGVSNAAALVVVTTPVITAQPAALTVAQGAAASFSVAATSANGTLSYQWRKGGSAVAGATSATLTLAAVAAADAGSYDCVVTNTIGGVIKSVTSAAVALAVNTTVTITTQPASVTQVEGGAATLTVVASGAGTLSYQWKKAGADLPGATSSTLAFASLTPADAASYTCAVTSALGGTNTTVTTDVAVVSVNTLPVITTAPAVQNVATGSTATFTVAATSTGALTYQWRKTLSGVTTNLTTAASYTTPTISAASLATFDGATYDCVITATLGIPATTTTVTTVPVALNVAVLPTLTIASSVAGTTNNFSGGEAAPTLTVTITNTSPALNGTATYQWKKGGVAILGATSATYTLPGNVALADAGGYTCSVTNTHNGAAATATSGAITINVLAPPVITVDAPANKYQNVAAGATSGTTAIAVTAVTQGGGTLSYQWQISTDGGGTWANATGTGNNASNFSAAPVSTSVVNKFRCIVTNTVGSATATATSSVCTPVLYQTALVATQPVHTNVVAGAAASLTVVPTAITVAGTTQTVQWFKGFSTVVGQAIPGATSATFSIAAADSSDAGYYYAIVTNGIAGATVTNTATSSIVRLGVNTTPNIVTQPAVAPIATEGTSTATAGTLAVAATGGPGNALSYQWRKGGAPIAGATGAAYTIASPLAGDAGAYDCVITSTLGALSPAASSTLSVTTTTANLTVNLKPTNLTPAVTGNAATGPVTLTVTPTNPNAGSYLTYQWKRNGTSISGAVQAAYTINEITATSAGNYTCDVSSVYVATSTSNASTATATSPIAPVGVGTGVTAPVVTMAATYTAGKTGNLITTAPQTGATYEWSVTNGSITAGAGTSSITVTAGSNTALPMTAAVVVTTATGGAVGAASATVVAAAAQPQILAPASVHPGDTWMKAGMQSQSSTSAWSVTGAGSVTGGAATNGLAVPFSTNNGTVNGDLITLTASAQNAANDAAPTATKSVAVTTGTWINKDGGLTWLLGTGSGTNGSASAVFANGRVLVSGGQTLSGYTPAAAALYDPATQRWTRVADMNFGRTGHTATALANGTVLVTGGTASINATTTYLNNAELYDPVTNTWTLILSTNMGTGRVNHTATLLTAGANVNKVVITGGKFGSSDTTSTISIFQASGSAGNFPGGSFSTSPVSLNYPRERHIATALNDGRVLVTGGQGPTNETYQQAEIFDPTANSTSAWTCIKVAGLTVQQRLAHTATLLLDGKVLLAGGSQSPSTAELFDPATGAFTATTGTLKGGHLAANTSGRFQHTATRLGDGKVLLTGGQGGTSQGVAQSAELYDPATQLFTSTVPMNSGRNLHSALALPNGTVMVLGGSVPNLSSTASTEIYDPAANGGAGAWTTIGSLNGRQLATVTRLQDGRVLVVGGQNEWQGNDATTTPSTAMNVSRSAQLYDPATGNWTSGPQLAVGRYSHQAVLLANGKVLVSGGICPQVAGGQNNTSTAELFDPAANGGAGAWSSAGSMNVPRVAFGMIALPNGKVLVMGGTVNGVSTNTAELYDPTGNTWAYTNNGTANTTLSESKFQLSPILLSNGKVVVAGGNTTDSQSLTATVEVFDPATQVWSTLTPLAQGRGRTFAFAQPNGRFVLVGGVVPNPAIGGTTGVGNPTGAFPGAVEIYDTLAGGGAGATVPTASVTFKTEVRSLGSSTATLLSNGKILLAAGALNSSTGASTSEIYDPAADTLTAGAPLPIGQGSGALGVGLLNGDVMLIGGTQTDTVTQIYRP